LAGKIYPYGGKLLSVEKKKEDEVNKNSLQIGEVYKQKYITLYNKGG
jgi:hypothetical protein